MGYRSLDASLGKLWGEARRREQSSAFSEVLLSWVGKWPYCRPQPLQRAQAYYVQRGTTTSLGSATSGSLQASRVFSTCPREPDHDATRPAADQGVTRWPLPHSAPTPPPSSQPRRAPNPPASLGPGLSAAKPYPPQTHSAKGEQRGEAGGRGRVPGPTLSPSRALAGPESGSTEVARPATPALSQQRSRGLRPHFRTVPSELRAGEGKPRNTWSFGIFPAGPVLLFLDS